MTDFRTKFDTKYTTVEIHDDHDGEKQFTWASVQLAWMDTAPRDEKLFGHLYDDILLKELREGLKDAVNDLEKDIRLEDVDVLINFAEGKKHLAVKISGIVEAVETMFDNAKNDVPVFVK